MIRMETDNPYKLAKKFFGLSLPTTVDKLKSAFRNQCKILHTDTSGKDTKTAFIEMKKAYDQLVHATDLVSANGDHALEKKTVDGTPLSELGLGLGPTKNGKDCPSCQHKGYVRRFGRSWKVCEICDEIGSVPKEFTCRSCKGTGRFIQRNSRKEVGCLTCKGTGKLKHPSIRML